MWSGKPPLASQRLRRRARECGFVLLICLLVMGYYIVHRQPSSSTGLAEATHPDTVRLREQLERGTPPERREALLQLIAARAENELVLCLASTNSTVVQMAITGLWECWLGEEGPEARKQIESGTDAMNNGDLDAASAAFTILMDKYPQWAEAANKQATVLYLQGRPEDSIALCQRVVALKPDHFGAWNGMALCAIQIEDWDLALKAVHESLRLQPQSSINRQLLRLVGSRIRQV